jgi:hypothetical protein
LENGSWVQRMLRQRVHGSSCMALGRMEEPQLESPQQDSTMQHEAA